MDKYIYDNSNGLWYELQGDYYIPCLVLPDEKEERHIGIWGHRHLRYLKEYKKATYIKLLTSGKLNGYLADIDRQVQDMMASLTKQLAVHENVTEKLKVQNAMLWVGKMNEIQARAREVVYAEIIYA